MAINSLSPSYVQINYTSNGHEHKMLLPCAFHGSVTPGVEPDVVLKDSTFQSLTAAVTAFVTLAKAFIASTGSFDTFYAYSKPTPTSDPTLIFAGNLGIAGTAVGATVPASEIVFTFKTPSPGGLKLYIMEGTYAINYRASLPSLPASAQKDLADFIVSGDNWITGRNNQYPLLGLFITTKQNDHFRRKYLL